MPSRPGWDEEYWRRMDRKTARKILKTCPRCGSGSTYYNSRFKLWRCGRCEHSWVIEGYRESKPWWKRLLW